MTDELGILTQPGKESVAQEREMLAFLCQKWHMGYVSVFKSSDKSTAHIDGLFVANGIILAAFESKCRLKWNDYDSLLITAKKIDSGAAISAELAVPFMVLAYIVKQRRIFQWVVTNSRGDFKFPMHRCRTSTQATIVGGTANRVNAFLPLQYANIIEMDNG